MLSLRFGILQLLGLDPGTLIPFWLSGAILFHVTFLKTRRYRSTELYKAALIRNGKISGVSSADWSDAVACSTAAAGIWLGVIRLKLLPILVGGIVRVFPAGMFTDLLSDRAWAVIFQFLG